MSSTYNSFYEQSYIPCSASHENAAAESGIGTANVDGKIIKAGQMINGQCRHGGDPKGTGTIIYMGGGSLRYLSGGVGTADSANVARLLRAQHL